MKTKKGATKMRHLGRRKASILHYYEVTYPMRKLKRLLKNNTKSEACEWANEHGARTLFVRLTE